MNKKVCIICKKNYESSRNRKTKYCSSYKCRGEGRKTGVYKNCLTCNKNFYVAQAVSKRKNRGIYCSKNCFYLDHNITSLQQKIRHSTQYYLWRKTIYKRDNYTCQICDIRGGNMHADHIKPFSVILFINNIRNLKDAKNCLELWEINNGRTLCIDCHEQTNSYMNPNAVKEYLYV